MGSQRNKGEKGGAALGQLILTSTHNTTQRERRTCF